MYRNTEDIKFELCWCLSSFATSSNDLTNQRLLSHVINHDYITHEFCVIPKHHSWIKPKFSLDQDIREILNQSRLTTGLTRLRMD